MKMSEKNIGFNRNIRLAWLDAAAAFCGETDDSAEIRARLETVVGQDVASEVNRRKAIDILINIWVKTGEFAPALRQQAVEGFRETSIVGDRLWFHYGLTLVYYSFFREVAAAIGKVTRHGDAVTPSMVKQRLIAERGQLGSLEKAVERVMFSMRDWGLLGDAAVRYAYRPERQSLGASSMELESWLLASVLQAHPAEALVFGDLVRLPEFFAFRFTVTLDYLRRSRDFEVERQGTGWDMVRFAPLSTASRLAMTPAWAD
jgi:hypothetical protein